MSNQPAANIHPLIRAPHRLPPESDPISGMRREITLLRFEVSQLRAMEDDARKTNQRLCAYIDCILENQYQWQREAERLRSFMKIISNKPRWSPFWWLNAVRNINLLTRRLQSHGC